MLRVRVIITGSQGSPYLSTYHFAGDDTQTGANNAVNAVATFWNGFDSQLHTTISWTTDGAVDQLDLSGTLTGSFNVTPQSSSGLQNTNTLLPFATQAMVRWDTGSFIGGRRLRGRTFVPGLTEAANLQGVLDGTVAGIIQTAGNTLRQTPSPNFVIWSRVAAATSTVASATVPTKWAVLRSRRD